MDILTDAEHELANEIANNALDMGFEENNTPEEEMRAWFLTEAGGHPVIYEHAVIMYSMTIFMERTGATMEQAMAFFGVMPLNQVYEHAA